MTAKERAEKLFSCRECYGLKTYFKLSLGTVTCETCNGTGQHTPTVDDVAAVIANVEFESWDRIWRAFKDAILKEMK